MTKNDEREVQRKLRVLQHAELTAQVAKTCRYFGIGHVWVSLAGRGGPDPDEPLARV